MQAISVSLDVAKPSLLSKSQLKERGWTDSLIKKFLGDPDTTKANPHYRKSAPMQLYRSERVAEQEFCVDFAQASSQKEKKRIVGLAVAERKRQETFQFVESLPEPELPNATQEQLTKKAIRHYNELWDSRGDYEKTATVDSPKDFLLRISVNYVRHELCEYEANVRDLFGKVGKEEAYSQVKSKVLQSIAEKYSWLRHECDRQNNQEGGAFG